MICDASATHKIKDTADYYCQECAEENFSDLTLLVAVEEEAQKLKEFLREKMDDLQKDDDKLDTLITSPEKNDAQDDQDSEDEGED